MNAENVLFHVGKTGAAWEGGIRSTWNRRPKVQFYAGVRRGRRRAIEQCTLGFEHEKLISFTHNGIKDDTLITC